mmetsp:Transcript_1263/g.1492  ORF Transcript_1263/g.1492 Transcript_1263/m.1492 type:complete len:150 (-) Transcript_1263:2526-2975(-)
MRPKKINRMSPTKAGLPKNMTQGELKHELKKAIKKTPKKEQIDEGNDGEVMMFNFYEEPADEEEDTEHISLNFERTEADPMAYHLNDKNLTLEEGISGMVVMDASGALVNDIYGDINKGDCATSAGGGTGGNSSSEEGIPLEKKKLEAQ